VAFSKNLESSDGSFATKAKAAATSSISPVGLPSFLTIPTIPVSSVIPAISNALLLAY
jgi:hypothetical protein